MNPALRRAGQVASCLALLVSPACGGDGEGAADDAPSDGASPEGGAAGTAGAGAKSGASGASGAAGLGGKGGKGGASGASGGAGAGLGGGASAGQAGMAGKAGSSGSSGAAGAAGSAGKAGQGGAGGGAAGSAGKPVESAPFDVVGIVGTGQSLSVGATSLPVISTSQPYANKKLDVPLSGGAGKSLVPLVEPIRAPGGGGAYPGNIAGETPHTAMANQLSATFLARAGKPYDSVHSVVGESGQPLSVIQKGGPTSYKGAMAEAATIHGLVTATNKTFGYGAVVLTHGESDGTNGAYGDGVVQLQADYQADLTKVTGQKTPVPLLLSQQSTFPASSSVGAISADLAWKATTAHPGALFCVGPKYAYPYSPDHVHLTARGSVRLGIKNAQVFDIVVNQKKAWTPLQPRKVTRGAGSTSVRVDLDVPVPPLAWDETLAPPHQSTHTAWASGRGFEVTDALGPVPITQVVIVAPDAVRIDLGRPLLGTATVAHAMTQDADAYAGGLVTGRRGQLRDSDPFVGVDATSIACTVQAGATTISASLGAEAAFASWGVRDLVKMPGGEDAMIVAASGGTMTLSAPWSGPGGKQMVLFRTDQRNHLVHFSLPIPLASTGGYAGRSAKENTR